MSKKSCFLMALLVLSFLVVPQAMAQSTSTISTNDADQDWTGISPSDAVSGTDDQKTVYFYNVGKKKFLGRGGNWGTECVLSDVGQAYTIASTSYSTSDSKGYTFQSTVKNRDTETAGYLFGAYTGNSADKYNYYSDAQNGAIFYFKEVTSSNNKKTYNIYSYLSSNTQTTATSGTAYYMAGEKYSESSSQSSLSDIAINAFPSSSSITDNNDVWILVTKAERHKKFHTNKDSRFCHVPGTALIQDHDFARKDQNITSWYGGKSTLSNGESVTSIPTSNTTTTYYVGNGIKQDGDNTQNANGAYMAANIIGASGTIKQTIENVFLPGWYEIRCKAFTTSKKGKVMLYAENTAEATDEATKTSPWYSESSVKVSSTVPTTYLASAQQVANDTLTISVCIKATENTTQADDESDVACNPIEFGVTISGGENSDITTIDDFELIYRGTVVDKIILDEENEGAADYKEVAITTTGTATKENVTYMEAQNNERTQLNICEVYLHRTLKQGQWNSIILPLRLYDADIKALWGDEAKVSEFKGANDENNPHYINFELTTDGIYPGKLYLIKPTALNTTKLSEAQTSSNAKKSDDTDITLAANTENVYKIDAPKYGVDMKENVVTYNKEVVKGDTGKELYEGEENKIQFAGTYFKQTAIVPGNSYYVMDNKWYYSAQNVTNNSKGFRAWVQQANQATSASEAKKVTFFIDGVNATGYEVTGIEGIIADNTLPEVFNIYNVSGQLVRQNSTSLDDLAKGIYIVAGKKYIIK